MARYPSGETERMVRDLEVTAWLGSRGVPVPDLLEVGQDWALLEDLGPEDAEQRLNGTPVGDRPVLASRLVEPLVALARVPPDELPTWNPPLDATRLRWELTGFELWFVRHRCGEMPSTELGRWLDGLVTDIGHHPRRTCHRDFHLNNLFFDADDRPIVIDAQDARVGPDTYDIVSLLEERAAPRLLGSTGRTTVAEVWARRTDASPGWRERYVQVRWQRALKVLGTFARLVAAGRPEYGGWIDALRQDLLASDEGRRLPPFVEALLIDSARDGGRNAR